MEFFKHLSCHPPRRTLNFCLLLRAWILIWERKGKKKKEKGEKEKTKKRERKENNALFSIKINKMQYIQISHRPGPWERRVRPSQAEGGRKGGVSSGLGRELLGPDPSHHSILPMTIRREGSGSDLPQPQSCEEQDYTELRSRVGGGEGGGGRGGGRGGGAGRRAGAHTTGLIPLSGGLRPSLPARR